MSKSPAGRTTRDLNVYLLGAPQQTWHLHPLDLPRRQVRALLYGLALRPVSLPRERLCFLFWSDVPESHARRKLSSLLSHLRRALPEPDVVLTPGDHVELDTTRLWSDTGALDGVRLAPSQSGRIPAIGELQRITELYRGPLLDGFSLPGCPEFESWIAQEREHFKRRYLETLSMLIEMHIVKGELDAAIDAAHRYLDTDPLAEDMHRRVIQLYATVGNRSAALQQYERCAIALERELGVSPLPKTREVYRAIRQHGQPPPEGAQSRPVWSTLPSLDAPLVGREQVLSRLKAAYLETIRGYQQVLLISGEPGIGKSRLMEDFITHLSGDITVLAGSGHEMEEGVPYAPLVDALRSGISPTEWTSLEIEPIYLAELARLLPELLALFSDLPRPYPVEPIQQQGRLFQALTRTLGALALRRPVVLCLDDLQWFDRTSISYLAYLIRRLRETPLLLLGAYRPGEAERVAALCAEVRRLNAGEELRLQALSQSQGLDLIRHLAFPGKGIESLSHRLHRATGGNPFFTLEVLRAILEGSALDAGTDRDGYLDAGFGESRELPLTRTVAETIHNRLRSLAPSTRQVLETAAVLGYRFDHDLLWQISGRDEEEVIEALESLLARQMLLEEEGTYRFAHDLVRNVVYRSLSYGRRRLLHRRTGEAIEKAQPGRASVLAHHFERAEELVKSIEYRLVAGQQAMEKAAPEEAIAHLTRAQALFRALPGSAQLDPLELKLQLNLGVARQIHRGHGDTEAAEAHARAKMLAQRLGDTQAHFAALGLLLMFHATRGEQEKAQSVGKEILGLTERSGDPALMMISHWQLGTQRLIAGDLVEARGHLEEAMSLYEPARHHSLTFRYGLEPGVMSMGMLSMALWMLGYPDQSLERGEASLALAKALDFPPGVAMAGVLACVVNGYRGDWEKVYALASETMQISEEHALVYWRTAGLIHHGRALVEMGRSEQGLIQIHQGIDESRATGAQVFTVIQFNMLSEIYLALDRLPEAIDAIESAILIARETGEHFGEPDAYRIKGDLLALEGGFREAEGAYQHAISMARGQRAKSLELRAVTGLTRLRQRCGCEAGGYRELAHIYDWFTEGFDSADLREVRDLLRSRR